jgi:ribosomal protein L37E
VAYTPRPTWPCDRCGKPTSHRDGLCNLCAWQQSAERDEERWDQARVRVADQEDEVSWEHLSIAHGFGQLTYDEFAAHYPAFISAGGGVDVAALHSRDHQEHAGSFDHEHQQEEAPFDRT